MTYRRKAVTEPLSQYVEREFEEIEKEFGITSFIQFKTLYSEPVKLFDGLTVLADGTGWNPGSGQGIYSYYASAWHKLG